MSKRLSAVALIVAAVAELVLWPCNVLLAVPIVTVLIYVPFQRLRIGAFAVVFAMFLTVLSRTTHLAAPIFGPLLGLCFALIFIMSLDMGRMQERSSSKAFGGPTVA